MGSKPTIITGNIDGIIVFDGFIPYFTCQGVYDNEDVSFTFTLSEADKVIYELEIGFKIFDDPVCEIDNPKLQLYLNRDTGKLAFKFIEKEVIGNNDIKKTKVVS